jgi:hypothetical protein
VRQLHVIGVSDDGDALLLGPGAKGKPSHRLPLDDRLRAVVRGQLSALNPSDRAEIALTPKEIQARLRAGATPEEVAKAAQVPVARVLPYAAPVLAERERIVEQARAAVLHRSRGPAGERPMGEVVDLHLADVAKPDSVEWTTRRRKDGAWVVSLSYAARGGRRTASWLWRALERDLTTMDPAASRLATEESATAKKRPARRAATTRPSAKKAAKPAAKRAPAKKATKSAKPAAKKSTAKPSAKRATAKPAARKSTAAAPKRATASRPTRTAASAKPARTTKAPKAATPKPRKQVRPAAATAKPAARAPKRSRQVAAEPERMAPVVRIVPDPAPLPAVAIEEPVELAPVAEAQAQPARRSGRVPVPSWSDVLLGVAPRDSDGGRKS